MADVMASVGAALRRLTRGVGGRAGAVRRLAAEATVPVYLCGKSSCATWWTANVEVWRRHQQAHDVEDLNAAISSAVGLR